MDTPQQPNQPKTNQAATPVVTRRRDIKFYFLALLIAGVAAMGLTSVIALLVGGFNNFVGKILLMILIFITHAAIGITVVASAPTERFRRSPVALTILGVLVANVVTSTLGLWDIIPNNLAWHILGLYFVIIGGAFIASWLARAQIGVRQSDTIFSTAVALTVVFIGSLVPWVLTEKPALPSLYYRSVAAILIIIVTLFVIGTIIRHIYLSHGTGRIHPSLFKGMSPLLVVVYSVVGGITAFVWIAGITGFSLDALGVPRHRTFQQSPDYNNGRDYYDDYEDSYDSTY